MIIAQQGGICPLCSKYISKGRSRIVPLPEPMVPRGNGRFSYDDGGPYNADGSPISMQPRAWVHEKCYPRRTQATKYVASRSGNHKSPPVLRGSRDAA